MSNQKHSPEFKSKVALAAIKGDKTISELSQEFNLHLVFKMADRKAVIEHKKRCMECGACAKNCPVSAITAGSGVGCAYAIINGLLGKKGGGCDCSVTSGCC